VIHNALADPDCILNEGEKSSSVNDVAGTVRA